jgi:hypothetical protein
MNIGTILRRVFRHKTKDIYRPSRVKLPEEYMEEYYMSLDMHYGDEPLYLIDPPTWPFIEDTK